MHLRYCIRTASETGVNEHPQKVMGMLGIEYQHATPQSIGDQWWFWNCKNLPDKLPKYLDELKIKPLDCIGFGLSEDKAKEIHNYKKI